MTAETQLTSTDQAAFSFVLNGEKVEVRGVSPQTTLLDYLRSRGLTGAKEGCAEGECGACAVALVKNGTYQALNSCLVFLPMAAGQEVYTVESLAHAGSLHAVQQAMADTGGSQCGYCTPGFVMSLFAEYYRPGRNGSCDTRALEGNLCRCTGYRPIRDAAAALGSAPDDAFRKRLGAPGLAMLAMSELSYQVQGARFSRPASLQACVELLADDPDARVVAGATDLAVESNLLGHGFRHLVSLEAIPELRVFEDSPDMVEIGACLTLEDIRALWHTAPPVLDEWLHLFASPLIRNRATLGGNLATASPIGDSAPLLLAVNAQVKIANARGQRTIPLDEFFNGYRRTALNPGDVLVSIMVPKPIPESIRFFKVAKRRVDDISTVAACFALELDFSGRVRNARFAYGGVAATPIRAKEAEQAVIGQAWDQGAVRRAQASVARRLTPIGDHRGSAAYRLAMAQSLLEKFAP